MPSGKTFEQILKHFRNDQNVFGKNEEIKRIQTGLVGVDYLFGGGVPLGRVLELYGFEGSGKTTLAAEIARAFQLAGHRVFYLDFEHSVDLAYFKAIGIDFSDSSWIYAKPKYMEAGLDAAREFVKEGHVKLVIVDSVASMVPKDELEGNIEDYSVGLQARKMGQALRVLTGTFDATGAVLLCINQLRQKIGANPYEMRIDPNTTPGGNALKFYASIRCEMRKAAKDDAGNRVHRLRLIKQKTAVSDLSVTEFIIGPKGIDSDNHLARCVLNSGVLDGSGGNYKFDGELLFRGVDNLVPFLKSNPGTRAKIISSMCKLWSAKEKSESDS